MWYVDIEHTSLVLALRRGVNAASGLVIHNSQPK